MISVYNLKKDFQNLLRPISDGLVKVGVTANQVTISAFLLSCVAGAIVYLYAPKSALFYWVLPVILFVRMALNAIDGMIAREHNQKTRFGAVLNELGDIVSDAVIYVPFLYVLGVCPKITLLFTTLMIISETVGIMGIQIGASRRYDGPMGKSDRAFWFGMLAIALTFVVIPQKVLYPILYLIILLLVYTIYNRISGALKEEVQQ